MWHLFNEKAWDCVLFIVFEGPRNRPTTHMNRQQPHAGNQRENRTMPISCGFEEFPRFSKTRFKHNASYNFFSQMFLKPCRYMLRMQKYAKFRIWAKELRIIFKIVFIKMKTSQKYSSQKKYLSS